MSKKLVNKAAVRQLALEYAKRLGRDDVIQRVGADVYCYLDMMVKQKLRRIVEQHPSGFKTLLP